MKAIISFILLILPIVSHSQGLSKTPTPQTEGWFIITNEPEKTYNKIVQVLQAEYKTVKIKENKPLFTIKTGEIKGNFEGAYVYDISYSKYDTVQGFYFDIIFNADNGYEKILHYSDNLFTKALTPFLDSFDIVYLSTKSVVELPQVNKMLVPGSKDYFLNKAGNQTIASEVIFVASTLLTILAATQKDGGQELYVISTAGLATSVAFRISAGVNLKRAAKALK